MINFKHLKPGVSLLEVVAAIALLALFGSSLFIMQQSLFTRMINTHTRLTAYLQLKMHVHTYCQKIKMAHLEHAHDIKKYLKPVTINLTDPAINISINAIPNLIRNNESKNEPISLTNLPHVYLIKAYATYNTQQIGALYQFIYINSQEPADDKK